MENKIKLPKLQKISEASLKRPKILLLGDDLTAFSGIATMSRTFVFGTVDRFNWVQLAAAVKHPDDGKVIDYSAEARKITGVDDAIVKLYPSTGYGDPNKLRRLLDTEKPDAIIHFTDPRFWGWLYEMEDEIHFQYKIPIIYYAIWDNFPYPLWNHSAYASCDCILGISKQSHLIHTKVLEYGGTDVVDLENGDLLSDYKPGSVITKYVPHGIDSNMFRPLKSGDRDWDEFVKFKKDLFKGFKKAPRFVVFWNNRNIKRKRPGDLIYAFKLFIDQLPAKHRNETLLLLHTDPVDRHGTDLIATQNTLAPDCNIMFHTDRLAPEKMNFLYNVATVTINIASNEGFGLSSAESIMSGTPIINNVTGGLQDQMRFVDDDGNWFQPNNEISSNHLGHYTKCGSWAFPIFPDLRTLQGSVPTPYIFDDIADPLTISNAIYDAWKTDRATLRKVGQEGREWLLGEANMSAKAMSDGIAKGIQDTINVWQPRPRIHVERVKGQPVVKETGVTAY